MDEQADMYNALAPAFLSSSFPKAKSFLPIIISNLILVYIILYVLLKTQWPRQYAAMLFFHNNYYTNNLAIKIIIPENKAVIGIVKTQAQTICLATPHLTLLILLDAPTPIILVVIIWVVLTGA